MGLFKMLGSVLCAAAIFNVAPASGIHADVTSLQGMHFGTRAVPWGGSIVLTERDAMLRTKGRCAFNVGYDLRNLGDRPTASFKNFLLAKGAIVAISSAQPLQPGETRHVLTQPYLEPGTYVLGLQLDAENQLAESNLANNALALTVTVSGACRAL
ncbi:CARDB domain-containing protein [Massilia sp. TS11]|uniref:CARDB domain-containing protein n=1 Tax=Massilia sp. TS11 TaxID=2908003 RepID=UPI001EDC8B60|nr:CARDB domain-containing protein [Massilia sp. TS11]MCG2585703.1 hypothetical protein [Massilia sp. TS11]